MAEHLSKPQLNNWKETFDVFDKNMDGELSAEDLRLVFQQLGERYTLAACDEVVRRFDTLGTGTLDFAEFLTVIATHCKAFAQREEILSTDEVKQNTQATFLRMTRGQRVMSFSAFQELMGDLNEVYDTHGDKNEAQVKATFHAIAGDKDWITMEEFEEAMNI